MKRELLEECELGDWVSVQDLCEEGLTAFAGEFTFPNGEIRQFQMVERPIQHGTEYAWKRVS